MRKVGATAVAKSISSALALILLAAAIDQASASTIVRETYPQDELLLDLIVRTSRDRDLLTPRQVVLQDRLRRMGVDAVDNPVRPDIMTAASRWLDLRAAHDRWASPRVRFERRWDRASGLIVTWEISEGTLFSDSIDTNVAGIVLRTPPPSAHPGVRTRIDGVDQYISSQTAVALDLALSQQLRNRQAAQSGSGDLLNFTIPIRLPRSLERIIGKGEATNIRISGTERISIGGQSTVSDNFVASELRQTQSLFPRLEFQQSLRVNLDGTVGEKIKVRISHDSDAIGSQSTEVRLSFEGDEDDIIRAIRAGDIDVTLPGSRLLGVGSGRGGLFGLKVEGALGPVEFTLVTSKENARQGNQTFSQSGGSDAQQAFQIRSVDFIPSRFFRLTAPVSFYFTDPDSFTTTLNDSTLSEVQSEQNLGAPWRIDYQTLQVYRTVGAGVSQVGTIDDAVAYLDATGLGFEGFGANTGITPGDGDGSIGPESGFDPQLALANLPQQFRERWERLQAPDEWSVLEVNGQIIGIQLGRPASENEVIAVSYDIVDAVTGELVRRVGRSSEDGPASRIEDPTTPGQQINYFKLLKPGAPISQPYSNVDNAYTEFALTWEYEYRNFYDLQGREIQPEGFEFSIIGNDSALDPPDRDPQSRERFIRIFGLDQRNTSGQAVSDGRADVEDQNIFYLRPGFLRFDHPTPMSLPDSVVTDWTDGLVTTVPLGARAPTLYTRILTSQQRTELNRFNFVGNQSAVSSRLRLNAFNILEGSEELLLDGAVMNQGTDYDIDYLTGEINLKGNALASLNAQTRIEVRFESDPLFGGGRTSLSGANLLYRFGATNLLSTTWLYQTRPNNQTKIRLGEEPKRNLVGNLQAKLRFQPGWLRPISDFLSREDVRQPASVSFDAEVAMSLPNPNTTDIAYLDDFESADQSTQIPMIRQGWWWASLPVRGADSLGVARDAFQPTDRAYAGWHRPKSVKQSDLNPTLSQAESDEILTTLELRMLAQDEVAGWQPREYAGMMRGLGEVDLSRSQFLEFWVDDGTGYIDPNDIGAITAGRPGRLHFDFGQINEDFFWRPDGSGGFVTGEWDKEDSDNDGLLGIALDGETEDRGLDQLLNVEESAAQAMPGRPGRGQNDPAGDDFDAADSGDSSFVYINGTENNRRLDTEDLSFNNSLDLADGFFRLTLELDDPNAFVDPARDYSDDAEFIGAMQRDGRSWRKYRLDLRKLIALQRGDDLAEPSGYGPATPDLTRVRTLRIWYEPEGDSTDPVERRIKFAEMRFLGNRWLADGVRDPYNAVVATPGGSTGTEEFRLGVLNNKDNPDYVPPISVRVRNNVAELEQSLQFTYTDLEPGNRFRARKDLTGSFGEDYLDYGELNFFWRIPYVDGSPDLSQTEAEGYFWIGSDSLSYYEISVPFADVQSNGDGWVEVSVALADLSNVKNAMEDSLVTWPDPPPASRPNPLVTRAQIKDTLNNNVYDVTVRGRPDLGRVQRYYAGVRYRQQDPAAPAPPPYSGEVLFNELRLREVNRDTGYAQRYTGTFGLPGLGDLGAEFSNTDEQFRGLDQDRGSGVQRRNWALRASSRLQNFIPIGGLDIPISISHRIQEEFPKYEPRSDIELQGEDRQRFVSRSEAQSFTVQFRKPQASRYWFLRYTLDPFTWQMSGSRSRRDRPEQNTRQESLDWNYNYDLSLRNVPSLPVPFTTSRLTWMPTQITIASRWRSDHQENTARDLDGQPIDTTIQNIRTMGNDATLRWRPIDSLPTTWTFSSARNLLLAQNPDYREALGDGRWLGLNIGFEEQHREGLTLQWRPNMSWLRWARPNVEYRSSYGENRRPGIRQRATVVGDPELDPDGDQFIGVPTEVRNVSNTRDISLRSELGLVGWVRRMMNAQGMAGVGGFRQAGVADSTAAGVDGAAGMPEFFGKMFKGISRGFWDMRPISMNLNHKTTSAFQHVNGRANPSYRLGLSSTPDFSNIDPLPVRREGNELITQDFSVDLRQIQRNLRLSTQTTLADPLRLDASFNWRRNNRESEARGGSYDRSIEWPNLTLRVQRVHDWRMFKWMGNPMESSDMSLTWKQSLTARGSERDLQEYPTRSFSWQPRWNARLRNGMDTSLNVSRGGENRESAGQGTLLRRNTTITLRVDQQFDARGRLSFMRFGQSGVGSTIDMTMSITWGNNSSWREQDSILSQERSSTRISVDPQFTYQFTRNIRGSLRLQYSRVSQTVSTSQSLGMFFDAVLNF
ncbi:hypothetical protein DRQ53_00140 [bacterium]|nr:MAG: hypothetical protein DRQ53_00140 [bacterium]